MSGTSMDGLDCGLFTISISDNFDLEWSCRDFKTFRYNNNIVEVINNAIIKGKRYYKDADEILGQEFANISQDFLNNRYIDLVATHGQTVLHNDSINTLQIGNPRYLFNIFKVPIVFNFRKSDIESGGNGAPLMPILDWFLFKNKLLDVATLNIGGMANISFIPQAANHDDVLGFDTGPGMALIDISCKLFYGDKYDINGKYAKKGNIDYILLDHLLQHKFINTKPPKSTGVHEFGPKLVNDIKEKYNHLNNNDIIRTFCAFTANSISNNINKFININAEKCDLIISGGGVHHYILMQDIKESCSIKNIYTSNTVGINPDKKESLLMSVLGVARLQKMKISMPNVTGASKKVLLGDVIYE